jgi:hypothetical protein
MQLAKLDEAEQKLKEVLNSEPDNRSASYYLDQIQEKKTGSNRAPAISGRELILKRLREIRLETFGIPETRELGAVLYIVQRLARERDPRKIGITLLISSFGTKSDPPPRLDAYPVKIDPPLINPTLLEVLNAIAKNCTPPAGQTVSAIKFSIEDYAVVFFPEKSEEQH